MDYSWVSGSAPYEMIESETRGHPSNGGKIRGVRCRYREEHDEFVRNHGKKKIWLKGRACFDRERQPRFVEVDDLRTA